MIRRTMFLGVLFGLGLQTSLWGDVIHVPGDQPSIQAAIDVAADGDRIIVAPGTYFENVNLLGKAVALRSSDGPEVTTIDANGSGTVVTCDRGEGRNTIIDGFTITGGNTIHDYPDNRGGGMRNKESSPTVTHCIFTGNLAALGGGMFNGDDSSPTVTHCTFAENVADSGGGMSNIGANPIVTSCLFTDNAADLGGGMFNGEGSSPTVANCAFTNNSARIDGGMLNRDSVPTVTDCTFTDNTETGAGAGLEKIGSISQGAITRMITEHSAARGSRPPGGDGKPTLADRFLWPPSQGSAQAQTTWYVDDDACPEPGSGTEADPFCLIQDCIAAAVHGDLCIVAPGTYFENINMLGKAITLHGSDGSVVTTIDAGGSGTVITGAGSNTVIDGFTITGGAAELGGGMLNFQTSPTVANCTFTDNHAGAGGGMYNRSGTGSSTSSPMIINCVFRENSANSGGGIFNTSGTGNASTSPTLIGCAFEGNSAKFAGGGIRNSSSTGGAVTSPILIECTFEGNSAASGAGMYNSASTGEAVTAPKLLLCRFTGNQADGSGGAIFSSASTGEALVNPMVIGCVLSGNSAASGGGTYNTSSTGSAVTSIELVNSTLAQNSASSASAIFIRNGISSSSADLSVLNSVIWNNPAGNGPQIIISGGNVDVFVAFSDVEGGMAGPGNIDADPLFVDADGLDDIPGTEDDNLRLSPGSPTIDAADNTAVPDGVVTDLDGNPRFVDDPDTPDTGNPDGINPIVDMGAYEFGPPDPCADEDGDGRVTICHIPPDNPDNAHTITVSINALPAHLAHGDHCGACEEDDGLLMGGSNVIPGTVSGGPGPLRRYRR